MRESRHYEIKPKGPCALPEKNFSRSLSVHRFYQSKLVEAVSGTDIAKNFSISVVDYGLLGVLKKLKFFVALQGSFVFVY